MTKLVRLVFSVLVSLLMLSEVLPTLSTFSVTPWIASLIEVPALVTAIPLTVALVSCAAALCFILRVVPAGS